MTQYPLVQIDNLGVTFGSGHSAAQVLKGISLHIEAGTSLGLVGESGSGKSTLAKALVGLVPVTQGGFRIADRTVEGGGCS